MKDVFDDLMIFKQQNKINLPVGWVQIFIDDKIVEEKSNLVLGGGREVGAQRLFGINTTEFYQMRPDYTNHIISHFAVGAGGCIITSTDDYTLTGPHICDESLSRPISLGNLSYLDETIEYNDTTNPLYSNKYSLKPIKEKVLRDTNFPTQPLVENEYICNHFTKIRCTCQLDIGEPNNLSSGQSIQISEAGLYAVNSDITLQNRNPVLFARICFSPKFKEKEATFGIKWNILC